MYKVFLVDDEIVIREGIRSSFPWDASNFILCGEAPDGEMALPMIQDLRPDILITDIRMPFMDGLALAAKVAQTMPWVHIVILSGYDDFEYARKAISLGVKEYLLKPVSAQKLNDVLENIAQKIFQERNQQANMDFLLRQLASSSRYAREKVLTQLVTGDCSQSLLEEAKQLRMNLNARYYLIMLLGDAKQEEKISLQSVLHRLADSYDGSAYPFLIDGSLSLLVLGESTEDIEERAYTLALGLEHEASQNHPHAPTVAIGASVTCLSALPQALLSAKTILQSMHGQPQRIVGSMDINLSSSAELMEGEILPLHEKLRYASHQESGEIVEAHFASLGDMATQSVLVLHYMLMDMLLAATRIIKQCGGDAAQVLPAHLMQQGELMRVCQQPDMALAAGKEIVSTALCFRDQNHFSRYGDILRKASAYIEKNHHRPEITLHDVASHVMLSNNHFCTIFSQEMGLTFTEYLTETRLSKAKHFLHTTSMRTSDIAYAVGYNDPHYFSYLFKKNTGVSPRDFKKSNHQSDNPSNEPK